MTPICLNSHIPTLPYPYIPTSPHPHTLTFPYPLAIMSTKSKEQWIEERYVLYLRCVSKLTGSAGHRNAVLTECKQRVSKLLPPLMSAQRSSWEQGVAAQALLECRQFYCFSGDLLGPNPLHELFGLIHDAIVRQGHDGRLAVLLNDDGRSDLSSLNPACVGESIFYFLTISPDTLLKFETSVKRMLLYVLNACRWALFDSDDGCILTKYNILYSQCTKSLEIWSDSVYMLPPCLVAGGVYYMTYPDESFQALDLLRIGLQQIILASRVLQSATGEWSRIYDLQSREFKNQAYWGVGNGWVCGGIIRVFRILATALTHAYQGRHGTLARTLRTDPVIGAQLRQCYSILMKTYDACMKHMRPDGLFHNIVDDDESFVETNLSQQLSYTTYRLLSLHVHSPQWVKECLQLPTMKVDLKSKWEGQAAYMRDAAVKKTNAWGFVDDVCGSPRFDSPGTAAEGQAWGILMEVARAQYVFFET